MLVAKADTLCDAPTPRPQDPEPDLRVLPVRYQRDGHRRRDFSESVDMLTTTAHSDWKVADPRSYGWGMREHAEQGYRPTARHFWWRSAMGFTADDVGVDEHEFLAE